MTDQKVVTPYGDQEKAKKEQVEDMFDAIAPTYDRLNRVLSFNIDKGWRKRTIRLMKGDGVDKRVLDIATGTADLAIASASAGYSQVTGLDLSEQMLAFGRQKVEKRGLNQNIKLVKGDSEALPYDEDAFDIITCAFGARNFGNLNAGLKEMHRVLSQKGQVLILEFSKPKNKFFKALYYFYFFRVLPFIGKLFSGDSRAYTYLPESVDAFPSGTAFADELKKAGFKTVKCYPQTFGICTIYQARK